IKRVFRVYPLYVVAILSEIVLAKFLHEIPPPDLSILVPRLLLIGDLFSIPYALGGVEWTLRVEILFYLLVATVKLVFQKCRSAALLIAYLFFTFSVHWVGPIPASTPLFVGYVTLYMPFLFLGSCIYFYERNIYRNFCLIFAIYIV